MTSIRPNRRMENGKYVVYNKLLFSGVLFAGGRDGSEVRRTDESFAEIKHLATQEGTALMALTSSPTSTCWSPPIGGKEGDSLRRQAACAACSLRWVPAADGLTAPFTSQIIWPMS